MNTTLYLFVATVLQYCKSVSVQTKDRVRTFRFSWKVSNIISQESSRRKTTATRVIEDCVVKALGVLYPNVSDTKQELK